MGHFWVIPLLFTGATIYLYILSINFPGEGVGFPGDVEQLKNLATKLTTYRVHHSAYVFLLFTSAYLYKQTFAIPGSALLNLLAGALYGVWPGLPLVCILTAVGASFTFLLSQQFAKEQVVKHLPDKVYHLEQKVETYLEDGLFFYLLFVRLFPMTPNWLINIVSPLVGVPLHYHTLTLLIGLLPYNYICVQTGCVLSSIRSIDDIFTVYTIIKLATLATIMLLPGYIVKKYNHKFTFLQNKVTTVQGEDTKHS